MFRYYPLMGGFHLANLPLETAGPAILVQLALARQGQPRSRSPFQPGGPSGCPSAGSGTSRSR
jgi:hypothetical protein